MDPVAESPGTSWQQRLCRAFCGLPITRLHFDEQNASSAQSLIDLRRLNFILLLVGFARIGLNNFGLLYDLLGGGTDFFSAILVYLSFADCCGANASFLIMFLVWAITNAILFDLILSLGGNLTNVSAYWGESSWQHCLFVADSVLIIVNSAIQLRMAWVAKHVLDDVIPNWSNLAAGIEPSSWQPLPGQPERRERQPPRQQVPSSFRAFSGSGQRLGAA